MASYLPLCLWAVCMLREFSEFPCDNSMWASSLALLTRISSVKMRFQYFFFTRDGNFDEEGKMRRRAISNYQAESHKSFIRREMVWWREKESEKYEDNSRDATHNSRHFAEKFLHSKFSSCVLQKRVLLANFILNKKKREKGAHDKTSVTISFELAWFLEILVSFLENSL